MIDYIQLFKDRNLFNQCTNEIELNNILNKKKLLFILDLMLLLMPYMPVVLFN